MKSPNKSSILTLDTWAGRLIPIPTIIDCAEMKVISHGHVGPVFSGPGHINIKSSTKIDFTIHATPVDEREASRLLNRAKENPYDTLKQFTVDATDYTETKWRCGWTSIDLKGIPSIGWPLTGQLNSLKTMAEGHWVADKSSIELVFHPKISIPMDEQMVTITKIGSNEVIKQILFCKLPGQFPFMRNGLS
jgi:hypothetical protein